VIVSHTDLENWIEQILTACGVSKTEARTTAQVLTATNLRGVDTHGVARIPYYVDLLKRGALNATPG